MSPGITMTQFLSSTQETIYHTYREIQTPHIQQYLRYSLFFPRTGTQCAIKYDFPHTRNAMILDLGTRKRKYLPGNGEKQAASVRTICEQDSSKKLTAGF